MLDLTPQIELTPASRKTYRRLRMAMYSAFILGLAYCGYRTIFPVRQYVLNPAKDDQTTSYVTATADRDRFLIEVFSHKSFISDIDLELTANDRRLLDGQTVSVHKTYKAFAYPVAPDPTKFPDGQLIRHDNNLFISYNGELRRFTSEAVAQSLGYPTGSFTRADQAEIDLHRIGSEIKAGEDHPDGTFVIVDNGYYWLRERSLHQFSSRNVYLNYSRSDQGVQSDASILKKYPVAPDRISYPSGTLLGYADGVFLVSDGKATPFPEPLTFEAMGYGWDDVVKATGDEMAVLTRQATFQLNRPHPDNTIFYDEDGKQYYLVKSGQKLPIRGQNILSAQMKNSPITVQSSGLEQKADCQLESSWLFRNRLDCTFPVATLDHFSGNDFRFGVPAPENSIKSIRVTLRRQMNRSNLWLFLSDIKYKFKFRYGFLLQ